MRHPTRSATAVRTLASTAYCTHGAIPRMRSSRAESAPAYAETSGAFRPEATIAPISSEASSASLTMALYVARSLDTSSSNVASRSGGAAAMAAAAAAARKS